MQVPKANPRDVEEFRAAIGALPGALVKPMFGNVGAFVNGNMFAGTFGDSIGVKLVSQTSISELTAIDGTGPYGPEGRPMGGYVSLPPDWGIDSVETRHWLTRAFDEVGALPSKPPKPAKRQQAALP